MSSFINISFIKEALEYVSSRVSKENNRSQILEPLSTVLKLAMISFKEKGTKIAVFNNKLYLQEPSMLQGTIRRAWGNNREEIHYLLKPIMRCIELFPPESSDELKFIYKQSVDGLRKLKLSYNNGSSTVCYTLDLYISIIEQKLMNNAVNIDSYNSSQNICDDLTLSTNTQVNLQKIFEGIWSDNDIILICSLLKSINNNIAQSNFSYLKSIDNIIKAKEGIIDSKIEQALNLI